MEHIKLKISLIQMDVVCGDFEATLSRAEIMINKALKQRKKPNVLVLPEMWTSGTDHKCDHSGKKHNGLSAVDKLRDIAARNSVNIVAGSVIESRGDKDVFNTAYIIDRQGSIIAGYDQVHRERNKRPTITPGSNAVTFDIDGICCGIILGYDLRFPEFVRQLALKGAKVLFVPGMWSGPREIHWKLLNIVRAIENQFFVVAVNGAGKTGDVTYPGMSMVVDPWGEILIEGDDTPDILTTVIDIGLVDRARAQNPVLSDRRPDVYKD
jgi:omega-amidase